MEDEIAETTLATIDGRAYVLSLTPHDGHSKNGDFFGFYSKFLPYILTHANTHYPVSRSKGTNNESSWITTGSRETRWTVKKWSMGDQRSSRKCCNLTFQKRIFKAAMTEVWDIQINILELIRYGLVSELGRKMDGTNWWLSGVIRS